MAIHHPSISDFAPLIVSLVYQQDWYILSQLYKYYQGIWLKVLWTESQKYFPKFIYITKFLVISPFQFGFVDNDPLSIFYPARLLLWSRESFKSLCLAWNKEHIVLKYIALWYKALDKNVKTWQEKECAWLGCVQRQYRFQQRHHISAKRELPASVRSCRPQEYGEWQLWVGSHPLSIITAGYPRNVLCRPDSCRSRPGQVHLNSFWCTVKSGPILAVHG